MDLEDLLGAAGYATEWVVSLHSALRSIAINSPIAAIVDLKLLDGDAAELVCELKRRHIPFVVHSALLDHEMPDLRGVPWVPKPAEPSSILRALEAVLYGTRRPSVVAADHLDSRPAESVIVPLVGSCS